MAPARPDPTPVRPALLLSVAMALGASGFLLANGPPAELPADAPVQAAPAAQEKPALSKYVGAQKCKSCHSSEETGDTWAAWQESSHAKAFEVLATPEAKELAKAKGIDDPQKADACVKCHVTAFGAPESQIKKGFEREGVQCEACHGPGEEHIKARMKAAMKGDKAADLAADEIIAAPPEATCRGCHNPDSPTFEKFCYYLAREEISHLNPQEHSAEELAKRLVCGCGETCPCETECLESCPKPRSEVKESGGGGDEGEQEGGGG